MRLPDGRRKRESTNHDNLALAIKYASRRQRELEAAADSGQSISVRGPTVAEVLNPYLESLEARLAAGDTSVKPEISVVRRNFLPYWSRVPLAEINRQTFYAWEDWRKVQGDEGEASSTCGPDANSHSTKVRPKVPARTTLQREKNYFVRALDWASNQIGGVVTDEAANEIRHLPRRHKPTPKLRAVEERRDALSAKQIAHLEAEFDRVEAKERARIQRLGEGGLRKNYYRRLMALHVRLLLSSGMRPGAEMLEITWDRVRYAHNDQGEQIVVIDRCGNGKTGPRIVNCDPDAVEIVAALKVLLHEFGFPTIGKALLWPSPKGSVVKDMGKSFKSTLRRLGFNERVLDEPLYICRHTYLTERLRQGVTSDVLAVNCGTSNEMIDRHYNHLKAETIRSALRPTDPRDRLRLKKDTVRRTTDPQKAAAIENDALLALASIGDGDGSHSFKARAASTPGQQSALRLVLADKRGEAPMVKLASKIDNRPGPDASPLSQE
jgi:integrase